MVTHTHTDTNWRVEVRSGKLTIVWPLQWPFARLNWACFCAIIVNTAASCWPRLTLRLLRPCRWLVIIKKNLERRKPKSLNGRITVPLVDRKTEPPHQDIHSLCNYAAGCRVAAFHSKQRPPECDVVSHKQHNGHLCHHHHHWHFFLFVL